VLVKYNKIMTVHENTEFAAFRTLTAKYETINKKFWEGPIAHFP
jgi:hypothetical protein